MCIKVIVQYACGCLGRTLGKDKCRYLSHNESLLEELQGAGLRLWARAMEINNDFCTKMREENEWRPYRNRRRCGECTKARKERRERKARVMKAKGLGKMWKRRGGGRRELGTVEEVVEGEGEDEDVQGTVTPDILEGVGLQFGGLKVVEGEVVMEDKGPTIDEESEDAESQSGEETETETDDT